jgi:hypothetical protein
MAPARGDLVDAGLVDAGLVDAGLVGAGSRLPITSAAGQDVWLVTRTGRVFAYGDARAYGDAHASTPVVGAAVTPDGRGYCWSRKVAGCTASARRAGSGRWAVTI